MDIKKSIARLILSRKTPSIKGTKELISKTMRVLVLKCCMDYVNKETDYTINKLKHLKYDLDTLSYEDLVKIKTAYTLINQAYDNTYQSDII